jgi:hypothetical protein
LFNNLNIASVIKRVQIFITLRLVQNFNFSLGLHFPVAVLSFLQNRFKRLVQCIRFLWFFFKSWFPVKVAWTKRLRHIIVSMLKLLKLFFYRIDRSKICCVRSVLTNLCRINYTKSILFTVFFIGIAPYGERESGVRFYLNYPVRGDSLLGYSLWLSLMVGISGRTSRNSIFLMCLFRLLCFQFFTLASGSTCLFKAQLKI